jgi:hypothetical protein
MPSVDCGPRDRPDTRDAEIEITEEMIEAAAAELLEHLDCYVPSGWALARPVAEAVLRKALKAGAGTP